ncbi:MAG: hypothetical protein Tsb0014_33490 [Pleurocapsa sp.]
MENILLSSIDFYFAVSRTYPRSPYDYKFSDEPKRGRNPWGVRQNSRTKTNKYFPLLVFCIMRISISDLKLKFRGSTILTFKAIVDNGFEGWS